MCDTDVYDVTAGSLYNQSDFLVLGEPVKVRAKVREPQSSLVR